MPLPTPSSKPIVGITLDAEQLPTRVRLSASLNYAHRVAAAGGIPLMLPPIIDQVDAQIELCDAFVLTGGDDPCTEPFGEPTHKEAVRVLALRQQYETALLERLAAHAHRDTPVLGVCLGMQMMALVAGGRLNQHLPDTHETAALHWDNTHPISPCNTVPGIGSIVGAGVGGLVHSRHRQAVDDAGSLAVLARAEDSVVEAVTDPERVFYVGVQWHPERTADPALGVDLFGALVEAIGLAPSASTTI